MEVKVATLEAHVERLISDMREVRNDVREIRNNARSDFRINWTGMIIGFLGMAALLAKGFHWISF